MKLYYKCKINFKRFFFLFISLLVLTFKSNFQIVNAIPMNNYQQEFITEELRLKVPAVFKDAWLDAEKNVWDTWLSKQEGYLGRQIFWDKGNEEALILVNWKNRKLWKSISIEEVNIVQKQFEEKVQRSLNMKLNPFKLIYEGELYKEG